MDFTFDSIGIQDRIKKCNISIVIENELEYSMFSIKKAQELYTIEYNTTMEKIDLI